MAEYSRGFSGGVAAERERLTRLCKVWKVDPTVIAAMINGIDTI